MHVVVLGGGQAGLGTAVALTKLAVKGIECEITLIDPKDFFEIRWASMRAFFDANIRENMQKPYDELLSKYQIKRVKGSVAKLMKNGVELISGDIISYDICLIAVGARCPTPGVDPLVSSMEERRTELVKAGKTLLKRNVVIVGGGTVGAELAGEIAESAQSSGHKVTLVHGGDSLVPQMRVGARELVESSIGDLGVDVKLNTKIQKDDDGVWDTEIEADLIVECTGYRARNEFMVNGDFGESVNEKGRIKTDEFYRVEGGDGKLFAFGDCCTTGSDTMMAISSNYGVVVNNIKCALMSGSGKSGKLKKIAEPLNITILTLGPSTGVADTPLVATTRVLPWLKNRDMFIPRGMSFVS